MEGLPAQGSRPHGIHAAAANGTLQRAPLRPGGSEEHLALAVADISLEPCPVAVAHWQRRR